MDTAMTPIETAQVVTTRALEIASGLRHLMNAQQLAQLAELHALAAKAREIQA